MKEINDLKDYRLKYKKYYGIDFDNNFVIHHIDLNHNNNDINNLILLPKKLHAKYHLCLGLLGCPDGKIEYNTINNMFINTKQCEYLIMLGETLREIQKWQLYKMQLDMNKDNEELRKQGLLI